MLEFNECGFLSSSELDFLNDAGTGNVGRCGNKTPLSRFANSVEVTENRSALLQLSMLSETGYDTYD